MYWFLKQYQANREVNGTYLVRLDFQSYTGVFAHLHLNNTNLNVRADLVFAHACSHTVRQLSACTNTTYTQVLAL